MASESFPRPPSREDYLDANQFAKDYMEHLRETYGDQIPSHLFPVLIDQLKHPDTWNSFCDKGWLREYSRSGG